VPGLRASGGRKDVGYLTRETPAHALVARERESRLDWILKTGTALFLPAFRAPGDLKQNAGT
jgi:hypothetical protein